MLSARTTVEGPVAALVVAALCGAAGCPPTPSSPSPHDPPPEPPPGTLVEPGAFRPTITGPSGRLYLTFEDALSDTFELVRMELALDDEYILVCGDDARLLDVDEPYLVFHGDVAAGTHTLRVALEYRGHGHGVFSYLEGYRFRVRAVHGFGVTEHAFVALHAAAIEQGGPEVPLEDRPHVVFRDRSADPVAGTTSPGCPWGEVRQQPETAGPEPEGE